MQYTYDQLQAFQSTMGEIDVYISDLNFDRFILEQQWQAEDEYMYQEMVWRYESQEWDYTDELEQIAGEIGDSYRMEGDALEDWIDTYGVSEYNGYKNRKDDLEEWLGQVEGTIAEYEEQAAEYANEKAAMAEQRAIAAAQEELNRAAEERVHDEKRIKRERETADA